MANMKVELPVGQEGKALISDCPMAGPSVVARKREGRAGLIRRLTVVREGGKRERGREKVAE